MWRSAQLRRCHPGEFAIRASSSFPRSEDLSTSLRDAIVSVASRSRLPEELIVVAADPAEQDAVRALLEEVGFSGHGRGRRRWGRSLPAGRRSAEPGVAVGDRGRRPVPRRRRLLGARQGRRPCRRARQRPVGRGLFRRLGMAVRQRRTRVPTTPRPWRRTWCAR